MKGPLKPRDKVTQKMTRDGAIEVNETQQTAQRISQREQDADFQKTPEQQAVQDAASQRDPIATDPAALPRLSPAMYLTSKKTRYPPSRPIISISPCLARKFLSKISTPADNK